MGVGEKEDLGEEGEGGVGGLFEQVMAQVGEGVGDRLLDCEGFLLLFLLQGFGGGGLEQCQVKPLERLPELIKHPSPHLHSYIFLLLFPLLIIPHRHYPAHKPHTPTTLINRPQQTLIQQRLH